MKSDVLLQKQPDNKDFLRVKAGVNFEWLKLKSKKPRSDRRAGFLCLLLLLSLTITYFHTGCSTIIGAKSFHGPVRDGKGWYRLAMVIRLDLYGRRGSCVPP